VWRSGGANWEQKVGTSVGVIHCAPGGNREPAEAACSGDAPGDVIAAEGKEVPQHDCLENDGQLRLQDYQVEAR